MNIEESRRRPQRRRDAETRADESHHASLGVGSRVREARVQAGLSGTALGALLDLDKSQISKIETETRKISASEMPQLARALGVTPQWILGTTIAPALALAQRLSGAADSAQAQTRAADVLRVESLLVERASVRPPTASVVGQRVLDEARAAFADAPASREEAQRQGRRLAELVRQRLTLGTDEIGDLADLIEMHFGADVVLSPLGTDVDGLIARAKGRAVIVASTSFSAGHVRFTIAHELGHHLVGGAREIIDEPEVEPDAGNLTEQRISSFAAHLLAPAEGVRQTLEWLGVDKEAFAADSRRAARAGLEIARRYGISIPTAAYQVVDMGFIDRADNWVDALEALATANGAALAPELPVASVRPPRRLFEAALEAALDRKTGTGPLSVLLEQADEDAIFSQYLAI